MKILISVIVTIVGGYVAAVFGHDLMNGFDTLGAIASVAIMGAFILLEIKNQNKS